MVGALYREASRYCFMLRIGLLFSARHFSTKRIWSAFSFINRLRTTSAGLSSPAMCSTACGWWHRCPPANLRSDRWCPHHPGRAGAEGLPPKTAKNILPIGCVCSSHPILQNRKDTFHSFQYYFHQSYYIVILQGLDKRF